MGNNMPPDANDYVIQVVESLMATSNSPTFGQSNSPRQDGQIINFLVCLVLASFLGNYSLFFWVF
jgi:hypothetical protein